jgi:hypothetical protein
MIIVGESSQVAIQAGFAPYDHVIQALSPNGAEHPLDVGSLPGRAGRREQLFDAVGSKYPNALIRKATTESRGTGPIAPLHWNVTSGKPPLNALFTSREPRGRTPGTADSKPNLIKAIEYFFHTGSDSANADDFEPRPRTCSRLLRCDCADHQKSRKSNTRPRTKHYLNDTCQSDLQHSKLTWSVFQSCHQIISSCGNESKRLENGLTGEVEFQSRLGAGTFRKPTYQEVTVHHVQLRFVNTTALVGG